jgi:hypothetical protein
VLLLGLGVFVVLYLSLLPPSAWVLRRGPETALVMLALLPVIAIALLAGGAPDSFAALFVSFVAAAGLRLPLRPAVAVTGATALGVGIAGWLHGNSGSSIGATVLTIVSIGVLMSTLGRTARANRELHARGSSSQGSPCRRSGCASRATCTTFSGTACQ